MGIHEVEHGRVGAFVYQLVDRQYQVDIFWACGVEVGKVDADVPPRITFLTMTTLASHLG